MEYIGSVYLEGEFLDGDLLKVSTFADGFDDGILGIAFQMQYDNKNLAFLKYEPGNFLEKGGDPFYLVSNNSEESKLIFGETLRHNDEFPHGGGKVADFYWQILNEAPHEFAFEDGVVSTLDTVRQDLDPVEWRDLTVERKEVLGELVYPDPAASALNSVGGDFGAGFADWFLWFSISLFVLTIGLFIAKTVGKKASHSYVNFK